MAGIFFLIELVLIIVGCLLAFVSLRRFGGRDRNRSAILAIGLYALAYGAGLALLPQLLWAVARTDNAFLGNFLFAILLVPAGLALVLAGGIGVRRGDRPGSAGLLALAVAAVGTASSLGLLAARGPEPWQTRPTDAFGAGTFGFDIVVAGLLIGGVVYAVGRALNRPSAR